MQKTAVFWPFFLVFLGSGPDRERSPVEWGDFPSIRLYVRPSIRPYVPPSRAQEPARQASKPASQASEPARQASEPLRPGWLALRPGWLALRPAWLAMRPAWLALRPDWLGLRPAWLAFGPSRGERTDGWIDVRTYVRKISPFYRTSSPIGAAALLPKGRSTPIKRSRARVSLTT